MTSRVPFNTEEFEAARMFVARLRSEAAQEPFDFAQLGLTWTELAKLPLAVTEEGMTISAESFVRAALVLLWTLIVETNEDDQIRAVSELGVAVARHAPTAL